MDDGISLRHFQSKRAPGGDVNDEVIASVVSTNQVIGGAAPKAAETPTQCFLLAQSAGSLTRHISRTTSAIPFLTATSESSPKSQQVAEPSSENRVVAKQLLGHVLLDYGIFMDFGDVLCCGLASFFFFLSVQICCGRPAGRWNVAGGWWSVSSGSQS